MAAKIDVLGTTTTASVAATTVYTVPADKAARVRLMFAYEGGGNDYNLAVYVGDAATVLDLVYEDNPGANGDAVTNIGKAATMDLGTPLLRTGSGIVSGGTPRGILYTIPFDYFVTAADVVISSIITNGITSTVFKVFGVEDDI